MLRKKNEMPLQEKQIPKSFAMNGIPGKKQQIRSAGLKGNPITDQKRRTGLLRYNFQQTHATQRTQAAAQGNIPY